MEMLDLSVEAPSIEMLDVSMEAPSVEAPSMEMPDASVEAPSIYDDGDIEQVHARYITPAKAKMHANTSPEEQAKRQKRG